MPNGNKTKITLITPQISMLMTVTFLFLILLAITPKNAFAAPLEWTPYGGDWSTNNSVYSVNSLANQQPIEKRLIALDSDFADFVMEADVHFADNASYGNAGFLFRMSDPGLNDGGTDSEYAYYAGIGRDGSFVVLGDEHYGYSQPGSAVISSNANNTYHLKVVVVGTSIKVYVDDDSTPKIDIINEAYATGMIGLRAFNTDASYSNLQITSLSLPTTADTETIDSITKFVTVNLQVKDGSESTAVHYTVDNGSPTVGDSVLLNTSGIHLLTYWCEEVTGYIENKKSKIIKVDLDPLNTTVSVNINDIVKLLNKEGQNGVGVFNTDEINLMLGAITPIPS